MPNMHLKQYPVVDSCDGCGACCLEVSSPPGYVAYLTGVLPLDDGSDDAARIQALPADLRSELDAYVILAKSGANHPDGEACLWFDKSAKQCKHYELRPQMCRDFEMGSDFCHSWRRQYGV